MSDNHKFSYSSNEQSDNNKKFKRSSQDDSYRSEQQSANGTQPLTKQHEAMRQRILAQYMTKYGVPQITKSQFEYMSDEHKQEYRKRFAAAQHGAQQAWQNFVAQQRDEAQTDQYKQSSSVYTDTSPTRQMDSRKYKQVEYGNDEQDDEPYEEKRTARKPSAATKNSKKGTEKKEQKHSKDGKPKKKNGKLVGIILASVLGVALLGGGVFALNYFGIINLVPVKSYTYNVADSETLIKYLKHPSLKSGDTLEIAGNVSVDVDEMFGGHAILPLVNYSGTGSVEFTGGTVVLVGGSKESRMDNVRFTNSDLYIDAPSTALSWSGASNDSNINVETLNGSAHTNKLSLVCVGSKTTIPVTIKNVSGGALSNAEVKFTSASCVFTEGETYVIPEIPANGELSFDVPVIITEAGRIKVIAYGADVNGSTVLLGESDYVTVDGAGYYAGDIHTHTKDSVFKREGNITDNIKFAFEHGMSFIYSVENRESKEEEKQRQYERDLVADAERRKAEKEEEARKAEEEANKPDGETTEGGTTPPTTPPVTTTSFRIPNRGAFALQTMLVDDEDEDENESERVQRIREELLARGEEYIAERLEQSVVDRITGVPGELLQLAAIETGMAQRHMLIYNTKVAPSSGYGNVNPWVISNNTSGQWTYQDAIYEVIENDGVVVLPHFFKDGDIEAALSMGKSAFGMTAVEILSARMNSETTEAKIEYNIWNNFNVQARQRVFAVMTSNNYYSEEVGLQYIKGYLPSMNEDNISKLLKTGQYIASNGPEVRFTLGGKTMGTDIFLPLLEEGQTQKTKARFYGADNSPLTSVTLYRYDITGKMEDLSPVIEFEIDLSGQGVYSYTGDVEVELTPNSFYRVEVRSESNNAKNDVGIGLSNPIWVDQEPLLQNTTMISDIICKFGGELKQAPNGTYYIKADSFTTNMLDMTTDGKYTDIKYHEYNSDLMADKVTVLVTASDATQTVETIYIIK